MSNLANIFDIPQKVGDEIRIAQAAVKIWHGGAVGVIAGVGFATVLAPATAGMSFIGVALETSDNTLGTPGTPVYNFPTIGYNPYIRVARRGLFAFNQSGLTQANVQQKAFFATDDNTITATEGGIYAGIIVTIDEQNSVAWVDISPAVTAIAGSGSTLRTTAPVTTTNVNGTAQVLSTLTVPANALKAGDVVRLRGSLVGVTRTSTDTTSLTLTFGTTTITTLASAFAHATTNFLNFDISLQVLTAGSGGTAVAFGNVQGGTAGATTTGVYMGSTAFNTTIAEAFAINGTFSASNTTDQIAVNFFEVSINPS